MPVFIATVEYELVIVADDKDEAERIARREAWSEEPEVSIHDTGGFLQMVPPHWRDAIPWGAEDDRPVRDYLIDMNDR